MNELALLTGVILAGGVLLLVSLPFWEYRPRQEKLEYPSSEELHEQLAQIITTIRDLDFDYDMGKVAEDDYVNHRKYLVGRGVSLLIQLDTALEQQQAWDDKIEALVNEYRKQKA